MFKSVGFRRVLLSKYPKFPVKRGIFLCAELNNLCNILRENSFHCTGSACTMSTQNYPLYLNFHTFSLIILVLGWFASMSRLLTWENQWYTSYSCRSDRQIVYKPFNSLAPRFKLKIHYVMKFYVDNYCMSHFHRNGEKCNVNIVHELIERKRLRPCSIEYTTVFTRNVFSFIPQWTYLNLMWSAKNY